MMNRIHQWYMPQFHQEVESINAKNQLQGFAKKQLIHDPIMFFSVIFKDEVAAIGLRISISFSQSGKCFLKAINNLIEYRMSFPLSKQELIGLVSACQQRSYAEQVELLEQRGNSIDWLLEGVASCTKQGISNEEVELTRRREAFGSNEKQVKELPGLIELFCQALEDFTLRILLVAAVLSIVLEVSTAPAEERSKAWVEGFAILVAVFVCASVTAVNDYQKERQFKKLNSVAEEKRKVTVLRNGIVMDIHEDYLLVGDIVNVVGGMEVYADGILLDASEITVDESAMTGEGDPVHKNILATCIKKKDQFQKSGEKNLSDKHMVPSPILMSGTSILSGEGKMMILVVGAQSCIGKIRSLIQQDEPEPTPLQQKLEKLATDIGKFGLYSALAIIVVLLIRFAVEKGLSRQWNTGTDLLSILDFFIIGITVVVVAIPEGLPLSVTISLAFSVKKMLNDQNLVRKMEACETMGGANNICSDKTGTLTMNKMTLTEIWNYQLNKVDLYKETLTEADLSANKKYNELFKLAAVVNSSAQLQPEEKGSSTEIAILKFFKRMGVECEPLKKKYDIKMKVPFNSSRKRMSTIVEYQNSAHVFIKGASELVLASSHQWLNSHSGEIEELTEEVQRQINNVIRKMAENSLRTICLAYKKLSPHDDLEDQDSKGIYKFEKENMVLLAVLGVRDIPRKEVPDAIKKCHKAGITVRMVTGDNIITAKAIARDIGITQEGQDFLAMEGPEFNKLVGGVVCNKCRTAVCGCPTNRKKAEEEGVEARVDTVANAEEFDKIKDKLLILARSRPEDKYCLVTGLKERGNIVAVTGDGTNDAPALKKADVGFAMGQAGTEVAREAAAIILIDDNFNSIVKAVLWGRNIYDSIRKFVQFQLTVNVVAVACTLIGAALLQKEILKPIQMLWINLIMDTLASLALATEEPTEELLDRAPHNRDEYIVSRTMLKHIAGQSAYQLIIMLVLIFYGESFIPEYVDSLDSTIFSEHPEYKWANGVVGGTVCSGRFYTIAGGNDYETVFLEVGTYSRHFTFIFNAFVMMQVFNFINARKLHEELNILEGITRNKVFILVVIGIIFLQFIIVTFTGTAFGVYSNYGLTVQQWLICIGIGSISIVINFILKLIPFGKEDHVHEDRGGLGKASADYRRKSVLSLKRIEERIERDLAKNHPLG